MNVIRPPKESWTDLNIRFTIAGLRYSRILLEKMQPIIYDEEEFAYFGLGERQSAAFKIGADLKKSLNSDTDTRQ